MESKEQVLVWLPRALNAEFREFIMQKYGSYRRGLLSFEAAEALRHYLHTHKNTQGTIKTTKDIPQPNVFAVRDHIKQYLLEVFGYEEITREVAVPKIHVQQAIAAIRGTDRRTIKKWLILLFRYKMIATLSPKVVIFLD